MTTESPQSEESDNKRRLPASKRARLLGKLRSLPVIVKAFFLFATTAGVLLSAMEYGKNFIATKQQLAPLKNFLVEHAATIAMAETTLIILMITAIAAFYKAHLERRAKEQHSILFIAPELGGFYAEYLTALVHAARENADRGLELSITPYVASRAEQSDFCPELQLDRIVKRMPWISGVFLIPKSPDLGENQEAIRGFSRNRPDKPLVTLDVYPRQDRIDGYPHFVGGNETEGGRIAATRAHLELRRFLAASTHSSQGKRELRVLVLVGAHSEWERQRQTSFIERLRDIHADFTKEHKHYESSLVFSESPPLNYCLQRASNYLRNWHESIDIQGNPLRHPREYHLIFACNDEMALGAAKALRSLSQQPDDRHAYSPALSLLETKIIGYDGTARMKLVLELGHDSIRHTVCVSLEDQARKAVQVMSSLIGEIKVDPFQSVAPKGWP
jgi:hypothetical protein